MVKGRSQLIGLAGVLLLLGALFALSVGARQERFGDLEGRGHEWLTGSTIKFTRNWYREGAGHLRFAMLENPRSIEFPTLASREPYVSYPVGCLLPVYALSRTLNREPTPALVMSLNLAQQLVGALLVFAILFLALGALEVGAVARGALAALGFALFVFLPGPYYWFQNVYFSDQAIVPIVLALLLLEVLCDRRPGPGLEVGQALVIGWGAFTDWFMVPVAALLLVKKWSVSWRSDPIPARAWRALGLLAPAILAVLIFVVQVASLAGFTNLQHKLMNRTGLTPGTSYRFGQLVDRFWLTYVPRNFGSDLAPWLLALSALALLLLALSRRRDESERRTLWLGALLLIPAIVHGVVFWQHSVDHSFTPLRFLPAFVCLPFALVPMLIARRLGWGARARGMLATMLVALGLAFLAGGQGRMQGLERPRRPDIPALGASLARLTAIDDVAFSPDFEVPINPPELLSYSMKRVYRVASPDSLALALGRIPDRARVRVMFLREPGAAWGRALSSAHVRDDGMLRAYDLGSAVEARRALASRDSSR